MRLFAFIMLFGFAAPVSLAGNRKEVVPSAFPAPAPGTFRSTNAKPPAVQLDKRPEIPGINVPEDAATGTWRVTDVVNGKKVAAGAIRVFGFDDAGHGAKIGEIAPGTVVTLTYQKVVNGTIFYSIPYAGKTAWINGYFLERGSQGAQNPPTAK